MFLFRHFAGFVIAMTACVAGACAGDGNRLAYLDEMNPYYPGRNFPKLVTPQWVGEEGVEAVVVLAIDDMRGHVKWETSLRPIIDRLKQIDGRAPISIMTCTIDPKEPHLQTWLKEGLSIEVHTVDHPCPLLQKGDFAAAKSTYDRCVDLMSAIPGNRPVAFRMPCCDSRNTPSPRFWAEIFNRTTERANYLTIDSSVFNVITPNDPELPRELVLENGRERFRKYLPFPSFVNTIDDYPYPYVIGGLCWEFPCVTPSDWAAQNLNKPNNPRTVEDLKAALDAVVIKQGVYNLVFHPHGWIRPEQVNEIIDHAVAKHGKKVKFLNFREAAERLDKNLLAGNPLRSKAGQDNGVRLLDLNGDRFQDVIIGRYEEETEKVPSKRVLQTRVWQPLSGNWKIGELPFQLVNQRPTGETEDHLIRFGILDDKPVAVRGFYSLWKFDGERWVGELDKGGDPAIRLRDLDGDGNCELIIGKKHSGDVFRLGEGNLWEELGFRLPESTSILDDRRSDSGLRFVDVDEDGMLDVLFSDDERYSLHLFADMKSGWSREAIAGKRGEGKGVPPIVAGGKNAGAWFHSRQVWWQNESTDRMPDLVDRRSFNDLLSDVTPRAKSAEAALAAIRVRPGFQVEQMAAEPLVMDPIAFAWGFDGRLWVVEMADYPMGEDGQGKPGGRVRFLEDTDDDGKYDRSQVLVDQLSSPTGVMPWSEGVLVVAAPDVFYAVDTDRDGRADKREVLYTGFHEGNQQHRVNGLRWGLDNWIYLANGESGGQVKSMKTGKTVEIGGRDIRIRPDTGDIEAIAGQSQFGREQDDFGNWFGSNNSNQLYHFALDLGYLRRNEHVPSPNPRVDVPQVAGYAPMYPLSRTVPRFNDYHTANRVTSACSAILYRDDLFGPEFHGNSFVSEPVHNLVHREIVMPNGATFTSRRAEDEKTNEFFASSDNWCRPATIRVGPDGALWVADMYRETIEHPEWIPDAWEKRLDLRAGHDKGRIYRVYPVGATPRAVPRFDRLSAAELVALFESPSGIVRDMAQQRLIELSDRSVVSLLARMVKESRRATARLHALCTLDGFGVIDAEREPLLLAALADEHPALRRHGLRLSEPFAGASPKLLAACLKLANDTDPGVRLQLAFSVGEWHTKEAAEALAGLFEGAAKDRLLLAAAVSSLHKDNIAVVLRSVGRQLDTKSPPPRHLIEPLVATAIGVDPENGWESAMALVGEAAGGNYQAWQIAAMATLVDGLERQRRSQSADGAQSEAMKRLEHVFEAARRIAFDGEQPAETRVAALRLVGRRSGEREQNSERMFALLSPREPDEVQSAAVTAIARIGTERVLERLVEGWAAYSPRLRSEILDELLSRDAGVALLIASLESKQVAAGDLNRFQKERLTEHRNEAIRKAAEKLFGDIGGDRREVVERFVKSSLRGDAERGLAVYRQRCASCHRWGNEGKSVGPDLASLADRSAEAMLAAILDPNRAVESRFAAYTAVTADGLTYSGVLANESDTSITLVMQEGKEQALLRKDLEELTTVGKSLMPEGLERELSEQDIVDVVKMLGGAPGQ
jgi:putative membrane-bound dehydrogenase-like protein